MGAAGAGWNATRWSETLFGSAFEERFGEKVVVHHEDGPDGRRMFAIRRLPNDEAGSLNLAPAGGQPPPRALRRTTAFNIPRNGQRTAAGGFRLLFQPLLHNHR